MSSFHKKNPIMDRVIKSKEFNDDIPKEIRKTFIKSVLDDENYADETFESLLEQIPLAEDYRFFMISKNVQRAAAQIDAEKIRAIFDLEKLPFQRAVISLGSDTDGMYYSQSHSVGGQTFVSFTFLAGATQDEIMENRVLGNIVSIPIQFLHGNDMSGEFNVTMKLLQILVYMHYGDITTKKYGKREKIATDTRGTITNTTNHEITYVNTLWKQRVSTVGFPVVGHWRMQPYGPRDTPEHKLVWIEEFEKSGYNRKATKESKYNN